MNKNCPYHDAERVLESFIEIYNLQQLFADYLGGSDFALLFGDEFERAFQREYFIERVL